MVELLYLFIILGFILYFYKNFSLCFRHSVVGKVNDVVIALILVFCICSWLVPYFERTAWLSGRFKSKKSISTTPPPVKSNL